MMTNPNPAHWPKTEEVKKTLGQVLWETKTPREHLKWRWEDSTDSQREWCEQAACNVIRAEYAQNAGITKGMNLAEVCYNGYFGCCSRRVRFGDISHERKIDWTLAAKAVIDAYRMKSNEETDSAREHFQKGLAVGIGLAREIMDKLSDLIGVENKHCEPVQWMLYEWCQQMDELIKQSDGYPLTWQPPKEGTDK